MRYLRKISARNYCQFAAVVALGLGLWAFWLEPASLFNEDHDLRLPSWPQSCNGLRVAVLADLHVGSPFNGVAKLNKIVDLTLKAKPDLILLAGDYTIHGVPGGTFVAPETMAKGLQRLAAPLGVFAVLGNHDHWGASSEFAGRWSPMASKCSTTNRFRWLCESAVFGSSV